MIGEQNALVEKRSGLRNIDTFIAGAALFETLFNKRTIGERDENSTSILIDEFTNDYLYDPNTDFNLQDLKDNNPYLAKKFAQNDSINEKQI